MDASRMACLIALAAAFAWVGCDDSPVPPCEAMKLCACDPQATPFIPADVKEVQCAAAQTQDPCPQGTPAAECDDLCRRAYVGQVAQESCEPVGPEPAPKMDGDSNGKDAEAATAEVATAWAADAELVILGCVNLKQGGLCHAWLNIYCSATKATCLWIHAVDGMSLYSHEANKLNEGPITGDWLDFTAVAAEAWTHAQADVAVAQATLLGGTPMRWVFLFGHWLPGNELSYDVSVEFDALTGAPIP